MAQDPSGRITLELNTIQTTDGGCLASFMVTNGLPSDIDSLILETALIDKDGRVERLTLFDFGTLPSERPRVRQFLLEGQPCDAFGAVLINGAQSCLAAESHEISCDGLIDLNSRVDIALLG